MIGFRVRVVPVVVRFADRAVGYRRQLAKFSRLLGFHPPPHNMQRSSGRSRTVDMRCGDCRHQKDQGT